MSEQDTRIESLLAAARDGQLSRREMMRRAAALGLSVTAAWALFQQGALAQDATPAATANVGIVNKPMTKEEITAAVKQEGTVNVGNWTYTANDTVIAKFVEYVKTEYGVDVKLNYEPTQSPSTFLTALYTALQSGSPSPYDVLAIEENYWFDAKSQPKPVMQDYLPSALIPNADRVDDMFKHSPTSIGFQASATPGIVYNGAKVDFLKDWTDLADERLKGRLTLARPGDITSGAFLLGLASALGKDYHDNAQMKDVIDFAVQKIHPNVLQYTTDSSVMQQLLRNGVVDAVGFWNSLARMEFLDGQKDTKFMVAKSGQYMVNGYMWIPQAAQHPILAQIFVNWRLSDDVQFPPDSWGLQHGPWAELNEGILGPSYEHLIPEWFKADYFTYYPTLEQLKTQYKAIDWAVYAANVGEWMDAYSKGIGQ